MLIIGDSFCDFLDQPLLSITFLTKQTLVAKKLQCPLLKDLLYKKWAPFQKFLDILTLHKFQSTGGGGFNNKGELGVA